MTAEEGKSGPDDILVFSPQNPITAETGRETEMTRFPFAANTNFECPWAGSDSNLTPV